MEGTFVFIIAFNYSDHPDSFKFQYATDKQKFRENLPSEKVREPQNRAQRKVSTKKLS